MTNWPFMGPEVVQTQRKSAFTNISKMRYYEGAELVWNIRVTKSAAKQLVKLPFKIQFIYEELVDDLKREGPFPYGWDSSSLKGSDEVRINLTREYRGLF